MTGKATLFSHQDPVSGKDDPFLCFTQLKPDQIFVIGQLGQSLDGRIATPTGESRWINKDPALDHLHGLRARVDAVLVGIGTVLADDPRLDVRRCPGPNPARIILDPRGRLPAHALVLRDDGCRRIVIRQEEVGGPLPAGVEDVRLPKTDAPIAPRDILARLAARGLRHILVEGGARTLSHFIADRALDRLHLLVAPVIIGAGQTGLDLPPPPSLALAQRPLTRVLPLGGGEVLFDCDMRRSSEDHHVD
jgi:diaminohydroxyphosphoribosylaminopyrimidine deaminase / 5-amino-6-(5-phosphoribosylamino)uracil reductase